MKRKPRMSLEIREELENGESKYATKFMTPKVWRGHKRRTTKSPARMERIKKWMMTPYARDSRIPKPMEGFACQEVPRQNRVSPEVFLICSIFGNDRLSGKIHGMLRGPSSPEKVGEWGSPVSAPLRLFMQEDGALCGDSDMVKRLNKEEARKKEFIREKMIKRGNRKRALNEEFEEQLEEFDD